MVRQQFGVDRQPVFEMVWTFSEHLQAEAEQLLVDGGEIGLKGSQRGQPQKPVVKVL